MNIDQWRQVKEIFEASLDCEPSARVQFIAEHSNGDQAIRQAAEKMLSDFAESGDFLEEPALVELGLDGVQFDPGYEQGRRIGPYRIVSEIGQGGMGAVYLAERADDAYEKRVAIKMVWPGGIRSEINRRFNIERRVLAALDHPNIARLLDGGVTEDGWSYVVMEYVDGAPITEYCDRHKLSIAERLKLFQSVCEAVQYAHQNLIVHRDLKPSNILVTRAGEVKLLDFGIAKILDPTDDAIGQSPTLLNFLTPEYASPEHICGQRITTASDVYSLGVLLYELLTGERPFNPTSRSPQELIRLIETHEPKRPSLAANQIAGADLKQLRGDLDNIILKALQKEPQRRYQSVRQFNEDIARHLNGEPVIAREATLAYRLGKRIRRNKALTVGLTFLVLALIAGLIVSRSQLRASQQRERAQRYELYALDMKQAGQAWAEGDLIQMHDLLDTHRPGTHSDEWRGQEWFTLWKLLHTEKLTLPHRYWLLTGVYTPDGKTLLACGHDGTIQRWDAQTGQSLEVFATFSEGIYTLLITHDGKRLIAGGGRGKIGIWDVATRRSIAQLDSVRDSEAHIALSADGKRLASKIDGQPIREWNTETGQLLVEYALPPKLDVVLDGPALYGPKGKLFCLTRNNGQFELWDVAAGRSLIRLDPQSEDPQALVPNPWIGHLFSPDGTRYFLPTKDFKLRVWDVRNGELLHVLAGHQDIIQTPAAISHNGKLLATGSFDRTLRLWDLRTGELLATVQNEGQVSYPVFSPDDKFLAAVCKLAFRMKVWDVAQLLAEKNGFTGLGNALLSPTGKTFLAEDYAQNCLTLNELSSGQPLVVYPALKPLDISHIAGFASLDLSNITSFSPAGKWLVSIRHEAPSVAEVFESGTGKLMACLDETRLPIYASAFSPDGKTLALGRTGPHIEYWDTASWRSRLIRADHSGMIVSMDFSPDSSKVATASYDNTVKVWDVASGKELLTLWGHRSFLEQVKFSPDGTLIASASWDFTIKLWHATTGRELRTLTGHANAAYCLAFSPDGKRLASGGDDRTVRIWDVQTGKQLTALHGHTSPITQVAFTSDGLTLLSSSEKETRLWRAATAEQVRALPASR